MEHKNESNGDNSQTNKSGGNVAEDGGSARAPQAEQKSNDDKDRLHRLTGVQCVVEGVRRKSSMSRFSLERGLAGSNFEDGIKRIIDSVVEMRTQYGHDHP